MYIGKFVVEQRSARTLVITVVKLFVLVYQSGADVTRQLTP